MTYSLNIINHEQCHLIQQDSEGKEIIQDIALKTFFETAQRLGFFPEGQDFEDDSCLVVWDFYGVEKSVHRTYASMMDNDCFGTEDLETIIKSFFDTFPQKLYWIKANSVQTLTPLPMTENSEWRTYVATSGESNHLHKSFINTEWSEYQTSKKTALEMLLKQLQGKVMVVKNQIENLTKS